MANELVPSEGSFLLFRTEDGRIDVNVIFDQDTVWLTQEQMARLFGKSKSTISEHISNIFQEKELIPEACTHKFGNSEFMQKAPTYYNLDVIISVGYRVKSITVGTAIYKRDKRLAAERDEDEMTEQIRMSSFVWSLWVTAAVLAFGILFIYQCGFLYFCFCAIYFVFLLYILKFNITMRKLRRAEK